MTQYRIKREYTPHDPAHWWRYTPQVRRWWLPIWLNLAEGSWCETDAHHAIRLHSGEMPPRSEAKVSYIPWPRKTS